MTVNLLGCADLAKRISASSKGLTVIDARPQEDFWNGHIPGAISVNWADWVAKAPESNPQMSQPGWWGLLADPVNGHFQKRLNDLGLNLKDELVVYADGPLSKGLEGRVAWMLAYLGAENISLLSGGFTAFKEIAKVEAGKFKNNMEQSPSVDLANEPLALDQTRRVTVSDLYELIETGSGTIWDARTETEYSGQLHEYLPRKGHIPGAQLFEFPSIFEPGSTLYISEEKYLTLLKAKSATRDPIVAYCELGLRASTLALVHEAYTGQKVSIFDGGFFQWSLDRALPVQCPSLTETYCDQTHNQKDNS